jgi:hypothetical protein
MTNSSSISHTPMSGIRHLQVYVEIPPSPLTLHRTKQKVTNGSSPHVPHVVSRKENTPITATTSSTVSHKRKLSDRDVTTSVVPLEPDLKAMKRNPEDGPTKPRVKATDPCAEFPNGAFYCHQCAKKRDMNSAMPSVPLIVF